jgi:hypothetical protein
MQVNAYYRAGLLKMYEIIVDTDQEKYWRRYFDIDTVSYCPLKCLLIY